MPANAAPTADQTRKPGSTCTATKSAEQAEQGIAHICIVAQGFVYKLGLILENRIAESESQLNRALDLTLGRHGAQALQP